MLFNNCGGGEDSWESLGLQGDPTSPFYRRSVLGVLWQEWCWSWNSNTLATSCKELTHWKKHERNWGQEKKGTTEDEMAGWHHWLNGCGFEWTPGVGDGQWGLACCDSWGRRVGHDWATKLNSRKRLKEYPLYNWVLNKDRTVPSLRWYLRTEHCEAISLDRWVTGKTETLDV